MAVSVVAGTLTLLTIAIELKGAVLMSVLGGAFGVQCCFPLKGQAFMSRDNLKVFVTVVLVVALPCLFAIAASNVSPHG
jgi:hypothetical protein